MLQQMMWQPGTYAQPYRRLESLVVKTRPVRGTAGLQAEGVRELKGAPLAVLILLATTAQPVSQEWLERFSGYSDKPVSQALCYLYETGRVARVANGWLLAENTSAEDEETPAGMEAESEIEDLEPAPQLLRGATARRIGSLRGTKYPASRNFSDSALISNSLNLKELKDFKNKINTNTIKTPGKKRKITNKYRDQLWEELRRLNLRHNKRTEALVEMDHITLEYLRGMGEKLEREGRGGPRNTGLLVCALESGEPVTHAGESVHETVEKFLGRRP